jgi:hypothetical protein
MDHKKVSLQLMEFNKTIFNDTFYTITTIQDNTARLVSGFIGKTPWLSESGKTPINQYLNVYKKGRDDFKVSANENFRKLADFITGI